MIKHISIEYETKHFLYVLEVISNSGDHSKFYLRLKLERVPGAKRQRILLKQSASNCITLSHEPL